MTIAIETLLQEPAIQAVGWALLHFVWQGTLVAILAAITLRVLRNSAADVRYVVAAIALALMATMPLVTGVQTWLSATAESAVSTRVDAGPSPVIAQPTPVVLQATDSSREAVAPKAAVVSLDAIERWLPLFVLAWMAGVAVLAVRLIGGWVWIQRMKSHRATAADRPLQAIVRRLTRTLHIRRTVTLLQSPCVDVPTVIGWMKPTILLPISALSGLSPLQVEAILAHELAHIRRHDYLVNLLQTLLETLLFYHPAVWWLSRRIRTERENCCDDLAVSLCGDPVVYARALADLEGMRGVTGNLAMAANGGALLDRVRRLLAGPTTHGGRGPAWVAASAAVILMIGIVVSAVGRHPLPNETADAAPRQAVDALRVGVARTMHVVQNALTTPAAHTRETPAVQGAAQTQDPAATESASQRPPVPPAPPVAPEAPEAPTRFDLSAVGAQSAPPAPPAPPAVPAPPAAPASGSSVSIHGSQNDSSGNFTWTSNGDTVEVKYRGSFELNDDDTDIVKVSPGGYVKLSDGKWMRGYSVTYEADASGNLRRRFFVGSSERAFEPEGREWLSKTLPPFVRMSGFGAEGRVARILRKGGPNAVLAEISQIEGSYGKTLYLRLLLKHGTIDAVTARRILEQAGREVTSDYEMATLLIQGADKLLADEGSRRAYLEAAKSIDSDYEMRRVFGAVLKRSDVAPAMAAGILEAAQALGSDYEAASLLQQVVQQHALEGPLRTAFFNVLGSINSGYEKGRVLQAIVRRPQVSAETLLAVLTEAGKMSGSYEASQVLKAAARSHAITGAARDAYIKAADRLGEYEQSQALAALVRNEKSR